MCELLHGSYSWEDPRLLRWRYSAENKSWICSNPQIGRRFLWFEAQSAAAALRAHC
jgi:hypothetical protein